MLALLLNTAEGKRRSASRSRPRQCACFPECAPCGASAGALTCQTWESGTAKVSGTSQASHYSSCNVAAHSNFPFHCD